MLGRSFFLFVLPYHSTLSSIPAVLPSCLRGAGDCVHIPYREQRHPLSLYSLTWLHWLGVQIVYPAFDYDSYPLSPSWSLHLISLHYPPTELQLSSHRLRAIQLGLRHNSSHIGLP